MRTASVQHAGLRLLVIEDNNDSAESLRLRLESWGHEVRLAWTGEEGVRAARTWSPVAVLRDISLPGMDGWEVARALRSDPATASVRLLTWVIQQLNGAS
jgi:CheY-like chemotaxis protein